MQAGALLYAQKERSLQNYIDVKIKIYSLRFFDALIKLEK